MRILPTFAMAVLLLGPSRIASAGTPVAGFDDEMWASGLTQPTGIAFLPGGDASKFLVIEKAGAIKLVDRSLPPPSWTSLGTIGVCTAFEMGLLGIAVYPDFDTTHHIYLYRTENDGGCSSQPRENQVIRVTASPLLDLGSLTVVLGGIRTNVGAHNGGGMRIGPDGALYIGVGENGLGGNGCPGTNTNPYAQDPNVLEGKILRIERDGSIPADNPFVGMPAHREEVFALGFRNPWRFNFDPLTGALWHGDVGALAVEEIDIITAGGNYGWPRCEGTLPLGCAQPGDVPPIYAYRHDGACPDESTVAPTLGKSITGGAFAGAAFGAFQHDYVFGDFTGDSIYLAEPTTTRDALVGDPVTISSAAGRPVDIVVGPDGAVYYSAIATGEVRRVAGQGQPLGGRRLRLTSGNDAASKRLDVRSTDATLALGNGDGSVDDPVLHGATLRIRSGNGCGGPCDDTYELPNNAPGDGWSYVGEPGEQAGYLYRSDLTGLRVVVKPGRGLRVKGRGGFGHALAEHPQFVDATLATGLRRYCMGFGGDQAFRRFASFRARDAVAPAACGS